MSTDVKPANSIESAHDILHQTSRRPLDPIFSPKSVAVIGATETLNSVGRTILDNLDQRRFRRHNLSGESQAPHRAGHQGLHQHHGRAGKSRSRGHHHAASHGAWHRQGLRQGRRQRRHYYFRRLQGNRPGRRGTRTPGFGRGEQGRHPHRRTELFGRDGSRQQTQRHVRRRHGEGRAASVSSARAARCARRFWTGA